MKKKHVECPECHKLFVNNSGLGSHRLRSHGVAGTSLAAQYAKGSIKLKNKKRGRPPNHALANGSIDQQSEKHIEFALGNAFGTIKAYLENYCNSIGVPAAEFAIRVAELLRREASGKRLGHLDSLS